MEEKIEKIKDIQNYMRKKHVLLLDLMIYDEIECQLEEEISDEDYMMLWCKVENAYLKAENVDLWEIVNYCINNLKKIKNMSSWDILLNI